MARSRASVVIGESTKIIEVVYCNTAEVSYICEDLANDLKIPMTAGRTTTIVQGLSGNKTTSTKTASINLDLGTFRDVVDVIVMPGAGFPFLVLGIPWFERFYPMRFSKDTLSVTVKKVEHDIAMLPFPREDGKSYMPFLRVISRTTNPEPKKAKPMSRNQYIKKGWGNRVNFQASHGLKMTPEDIEEGNMILKLLMEDEEEEADRIG